MDVGSIIVIFCIISAINCQMQPFVVAGKCAKITKFPHSAFMKIYCTNLDTGKEIPWICGASIVNEKIVLTAAHCLSDCAGTSRAIISVGCSDKKGGISTTVLSFVVHEGYRDHKTANDIALAKTKTEFVFGPTVKRIALMEDPPYYEKAQIAGWGLINVSLLIKFLNMFDIYSYILLALSQKIIDNLYIN